MTFLKLDRLESFVGEVDLAQLFLVVIILGKAHGGYNTFIMADGVVNSLQRIRLKGKITQEELAHTVGVTRQTIIAIEKGNYTPSVSLALKIAHFFKKPVESIFALQI